MQNWIKRKFLAVKIPFKSLTLKGKYLGVSELRGGVGTIGLTIFEISDF